jgi:DNA-directed RNA polymerase subunit RPC12/RpoP
LPLTERSDQEVLELLEAPAEPMPVEYLPASWLAATHQTHYLRWMMLATFAGLGLAALRWIGEYPGLHLPPALLGWIGGLAAALVCGGLLLTLGGVRCRECGCRVALHFIRHERFTHWMQALQGATACPRCGHHPGSARDEA